VRELNQESMDIEYNTGVQQGHNALPVLFAYVIQAFLDNLRTEVKTSKFQSFKPPQNGKPQSAQRQPNRSAHLIERNSIQPQQHFLRWEPGRDHPVDTT
jgi:hypothetical protein